MEIGDPISPDGRTVAFVAAVAGPTMIWVRPLDASTARALPSTEGAGRPFWSPDSRSLAFFAGSQLKRIALAGGLPTVLTDEPGRDVAWSADGVMLIGGGNRPLRRLPASGGVPTPVTALAPGELTHDYPQFLPDGQHFVYLSRRGPTVEDWDVFVGSLDSKERQRLDGIHGAVRYSVSGHLMFTQGETLLAQRFNLKRLALDGDPEPVADGIAAGPRPLFDVSPNGTLVYLRAVQAAESQLAWIDRSGRTVTPFSAAGASSRVALSDDGRYLAFERNFDVMLFDIARNATSNLIVRDGADIAPVFSPDSTRVAFSGGATGSNALNNPNNGDLYQRTLGTTEREILLYSDEAGKTPTDWSSGGYVAYTSRNDIWAVQASPNSTPVRVTNTGFAESAGQFSPDGQWIAYQSTDSATASDIYVQSFPDGGRRYPVSAGGGTTPRWSPRGDELFYLAPDLTLMAVPIERVGTNLNVGKASRLFQTPAFQATREFEVAPDGRFLINVPVSAPPAAALAVVVNWDGKTARR